MPDPPASIKRIVREKKANRNSTKYKGTYRVVDDASDQVLAECDLVGSAALTDLVVCDAKRPKGVTKGVRSSK